MENVAPAVLTRVLLPLVSVLVLSLRIWIAAQTTWTSPWSELLLSAAESSLVAEPLAVLLMSPVGVPLVKSAAVVAAVTVIVLDPGNGISPKLQVKMLRPACGLVPQLAASAPATVQLLVAGPGRVSVRVTPVAVIGPLFVVTIVNTALLPA